ncbi:Dormancy/auxin associated family protein [Euphorbia peplus]|nr:Dormancy/auxin associated family protein [Euphorbia peplus]
MGILHKLWDETLAGPTPDNGLGKLRKFYSMNGSSHSSAFVVPDDDDGHNIGISRSITVLKNNNPRFKNLSVDTTSGSVPDSPLSSTSSTPFTPGTPGDQIQRLTWRKSSGEIADRAEPRTPTVYDWIVISALDR